MNGSGRQNLSSLGPGGSVPHPTEAQGNPWAFERLAERVRCQLLGTRRMNEDNFGATSRSIGSR